MSADRWPGAYTTYGMSITEQLADHVREAADALSKADYSAIERRILSYYWDDAVASWDLDLWKGAYDIARQINSEPLRYEALIAMHRQTCRRGEMVDALALGASSARSVGSSPSACTSHPGGYDLPFGTREDFVAGVLPMWPVVAVRDPETTYEIRWFA